MNKRMVGLVLGVMVAGCGSDTGSGSTATTQSSSAPSSPSTSSAPAPSDSSGGTNGTGGNGGVTVNNTNVNTNTSGSSSSSGSSANSGSSAGAQAGAGAAAGASASASASGTGPAHFSLVTASEGPERDVDRVRLEVHAVVLFWAGFDTNVVRDGMSCRINGATVTVISAGSSVQENPAVFVFPNVQTVAFDFAHPEVTSTLASITTDHLGTPQMVWVLARAFVHHVGARQDREAHGLITCTSDDGLPFILLRLAPPVNLRGDHLSTAGFHLRADDITERTVSCTPTAGQPRPPECAAAPEAFEPSDARISFSIASGFASTATEQ